MIIDTTVLQLMDKFFALPVIKAVKNVLRLIFRLLAHNVILKKIIDNLDNQIIHVIVLMVTIIKQASRYVKIAIIPVRLVRDRLHVLHVMRCLVEL